MNLNSPDLLAFFDSEVRCKESVLAATYRTEISGGVNRVIGPSASEWLNWIDYYDFTSIDAETVVKAQIDFYASLGHGFRWKIYSHDPPLGLPDILNRHGFVKDHESSLMVIETAQCPKPEPDGIEYEKVHLPKKLAAGLRPIVDTVWDDGAEELIDAFAAELRDMGDHISIHLAKESGETVGCGIVRYDRDFTFGGLFAGATVPSARRRGIYRGMVGCRAQEALGFGARYLYTEAGTMSKPIVDSIGFIEISSIANYVFKAAEKG